MTKTEPCRLSHVRNRHFSLTFFHSSQNKATTTDTMANSWHDGKHWSVLCFDQSTNACWLLDKRTDTVVMNSRAIGDLLNYSYNSVRERMTKVWDTDNEFRVLDVMHLDELSSGAKRSKFGPLSFLEVAVNHKIKRLNFEKPRQTKEEFMSKVLQKLSILGLTAEVDSHDKVTVSIMSTGLTPVPRGTVNAGADKEKKQQEASSPPQSKEGNRSPRSEGPAKPEEEGTFTVENFLKNSQKFDNALENMLESISKGPSNGNSRKRKSPVDEDEEFEPSRPKKRRASDRSSSSVASDVSVQSAEEDSPHHIVTSVEEDVNLFLRYALLAERTPMVH